MRKTIIRATWNGMIVATSKTTSSIEAIHLFDVFLSSLFAMSVNILMNVVDLLRASNSEKSLDKSDYGGQDIQYVLTRTDQTSCEEPHWECQ
jgi:hypothetical protein